MAAVPRPSLTMQLRPRRQRRLTQGSSGRACRKKDVSPAHGLLFDLLPDDLFYHVLSFATRPTETVVLLCRSIVTLSKSAQQSVEEGRLDMWSLILDREYRGGVSLLARTPDSPCSVADVDFGGGADGGGGASAAVGGGTGSLAQQQQHQRPTRASKRQRLLRHRSDPRLAMEEVRAAHLTLCERTDDAHSALASMVENSDAPLSLVRLRRLFRDHGPDLFFDRRSQWGRTFLVECCAANYVCEAVILRCVQELVGNRGADPDVWTTGENPDADRPAIFFAVARVMPSVVRYLVEDGRASLTVRVEGRFRLVSDPANTIYGKYTPLEFAEALKKAEVGSFGRSHPYWFSKLNKIIRLLSIAEKNSAARKVRGQDFESA